MLTPRLENRYDEDDEWRWIPGRIQCIYHILGRTIGYSDKDCVCRSWPCTDNWTLYRLIFLLTYFLKAVPLGRLFYFHSVKFWFYKPPYYPCWINHSVCSFCVLISELFKLIDVFFLTVYTFSFLIEYFIFL